MVKPELGVWVGRIPSLSQHQFYPFFVFLSFHLCQTAGAIVTVNGSKRVVSAKEVPFGGLDDK